QDRDRRQNHRARNGAGLPQGRNRQVLRRRRHAQAQAARQAEGRQKTHAAIRQGRHPAGGLHRGVEGGCVAASTSASWRTELGTPAAGRDNLGSREENLACAEEPTMQHWASFAATVFIVVAILALFLPRRQVLLLCAAALAGIVAFVLVEWLGSPRNAYFFVISAPALYALSAILGYVWPTQAWQWGLAPCLRTAHWPR